MRRVGCREGGAVSAGQKARSTEKTSACSEPDKKPDKVTGRPTSRMRMAASVPSNNARCEPEASAYANIAGTPPARHRTAQSR